MKSTKWQTFLLCWCLIAVVPIAGWSESQALPTTRESQEKLLAEEEHSKTIKKQIEERGTGEKAKVKITLRDRTQLNGYVNQIDAHSFQLTEKKRGQLRTLTYQEVQKVQKPGMSTAAKIGIAVGVGVGIAIVIGLASLAASGE